jgi:hypothetical protein
MIINFVWRKSILYNMYELAEEIIEVEESIPEEEQENVEEEV